MYCYFMNKSQWYVLSFVCLGVMLLFISLDYQWNAHCTNAWESDRPLDAMDITACVKAEVYAPFIILSFIFANTFWILAWLEKDKKKKK